MKLCCCSIVIREKYGQTECLSKIEELWTEKWNKPKYIIIITCFELSGWMETYDGDDDDDGHYKNK